MSRQLSSVAETLRQQIKRMITEAQPKRDHPDGEEKEMTVFVEDANGKVYEGGLLEEKIYDLVRELGLGEVRRYFRP